MALHNVHQFVPRAQTDHEQVWYSSKYKVFPNKGGKRLQKDLGIESYFYTSLPIFSIKLSMLCVSQVLII